MANDKQFRIEPLGQENFVSFCRFAERVWQRPRHSSYYRWRYLDAPGHHTLLALRGDACLASISAFKRRYRFGDDEVDCLEPFDWFTVPEGRGLGLLVMMKLMDLGHPLVGMGGSEDTLRLLPRLGWKRIGTGKTFALRLSGEGLQEKYRGRIYAPLVPKIFDLFRKIHPHAKRRFHVKNGRVYPIGQIDETVLKLYREPTEYTFGPIPDIEFQRWLTRGFSGAGLYLPFRFVVDRRLRGWSLALVNQSTAGLNAKIIDLYAPQPSEGIYAWMISEIVTVLRAFAPTFVTTTTTCLSVQKALHGQGFRIWKDSPVNLWSIGKTPPEGPMYLCSNRADASFSVPTHENFLAAGFIGEDSDKRYSRPTCVGEGSGGL